MTQQLTDMARQFLAADISEDSFLASVCNRPSWDTAPQWANWLAQDSCGRWYWYSIEPMYTKRGEWIVEGIYGDSTKALIKSAETTLQQRPEEQV